MTTTITGVGSGFDIDSWVSQLVEAKQTSLITPLEEKLSTLNTKNSAVSSLESKFQTLKTSLQAFTNVTYGYSGDMWSNNTITSSDDSYVSATSSGSVSSGSIDIEVEQIATSTIAKSANSLGVLNTATASSVLFSNIANGQTKAGTFSMFLNNEQFEIEIEEDDTIGDIINKINNDTNINGKIQASIDDNGKFTIKATDDSSVLVLGSSGDTSNFASSLKLYSSDGNTSSYTSEYAISKVNTSRMFGSDGCGIDGITFEDGSKITINGVDFDVNSSMTMSELITKINGNSEVKVSASYDSLTSKFVLTSTQTGQCNISLSESGTNLLQKLGLTEDGDTPGTEKLKSGSQTLGQNAIAKINGNRVVSTSNTITGESSGISNLSITIKKPTGTYSDDSDAKDKISLDVTPDYAEVKEALQTFVNAYNDVVSSTKNAVSSTGTIGSDSSLSSILSQIKTITSMVGDNSGSLAILSDIGISTSSSDTTNLSIDSEKLDKALSENFDSVKALLSDGSNSKVDNGLFDRMLSYVNTTLDSDSGYFANKSTSLESQISSLNDRIERANTQLTNYETRITKQFNDMDSTLANLNSQLSTFQSYFG